MASKVNRVKKTIVSGFLNNSLQNIGPLPIVVKRAPINNEDYAEIGTIWANTETDTLYINVKPSLWISLGQGGAGQFTSLIIDPGDITVTDGNVDIELGDLNVDVGNILVDLGDITATDGDIVATNGNIEAVNGDIIATAGNITAELDIVSLNGEIEAAVGNITATLGDIIAADGDIEATNGNLSVGGDGTITGILTVNTGASFQVGGSFAVQGGVVNGGAGVDTVVLNANVGVANFVGFTTAAAAQQVLTITNSAISAAAGLLISVANGGADDAQMSISRVEKGAGSVDITLTNNGGDSLNVASIISVTFQVIGV